MTQYYYLVSSLPPLKFNIESELSFSELFESLEENLDASDLLSLKHLLEPIDLYNIKAFWMGEPLDERGTLSPKELEEALLVKESLPSYVLSYLERFESTEDRIQNFSLLFAEMYRQKFPGFLGDYFAFERECRLVLSALRAKKRKESFTKVFQFEDVKDPFIRDILAQKDAADYNPPREYEGLKTLFSVNQDRPKDLSLAVLKFQFDWIEERGEREQFTLDQVLAYTAQLIALESYMQLDREKGKRVIEELWERQQEL